MDRLRYLGLRLSWGIWRWLRSRWTIPGWFMLSGLILTAALGLDTNVSTAYQAFTFVASIALFSMLSALTFRPRLRLTRALPRFGTAGQPLHYTVRAENLGASSLVGLAFSDDARDPMPSFEEFRRRRDVPDAHWVERATGDGRWRSLIEGRSLAPLEETALPDLPPGGSCELARQITPSRRGMLRLDRLAAARTDAFGLYKGIERSREAQSVVILPKRYPVPPLSFGGTRKYQPGGVALASSIGDSQEFAALRDYRPGDALRRIHWKNWAHAGKPVVKELEDEYFVRHALVLDTFCPDPGAAFEDAVSVAASFACSVLTQESLLDLLFVGAQAHCVTAGRGLGGVERMLEILAGVQPCRDKPFTVLHAAVLERSRDLSGCVCVLLSLDERRLGLARDLRGRGIPLLALAVAEETSPDAEALGIRLLKPGKIAEGLAGLRE